MRKRTHLEFKKQIYDIYKNEYEILEEYKGAATKILVRHNKCGREYMVNPTNLLKGHGCLECFKKYKINKDKRISKEEILKYILQFKNNSFKLLDCFYKNGRLYIKTQHLLCGENHTQTFQSFKNTIGCKYCSEKQRRTSKMIDNNTFLERVKKIHSNEYTFLEEYKGCDIKITVRHNECGNIYKVSPSKFLNNRKCPKCAIEIRNKNKTMTEKEFQDKLNKTWGKEYITLTEYKKNNIKILVKHIKCGNEWMITPASLLNGNGCPKCSCMNSKGAKSIEKFLKNNKIKYKREYKFQDCKNIFPLPFDFYIKDYNTCIEYDGEQHFKPIEFYGGIKKFKERKINDEIKNRYCIDNKIKLIRINYKQDKEISNILKQELRI